MPRDIEKSVHIICFIYTHVVCSISYHTTYHNILRIIISGLTYPLKRRKRYVPLTAA